MVTVGDVSDFFEMYPNMPYDQAKHALNIGTRCSGCQQPDSPIVDITFQKLIKDYKNIL